MLHVNVLLFDFTADAKPPAMHISHISNIAPLNVASPIVAVSPSTDSEKATVWPTIVIIPPVDKLIIENSEAQRPKSAMSSRLENLLRKRPIAQILEQKHILRSATVVEHRYNVFFPFLLYFELYFLMIFATEIFLHYFF